MKLNRIAFVASDSPAARRAMNRLRKLFGTHEPENADVVVALGGDGMMLQTMHRFVSTGLPIYDLYTLVMMATLGINGREF